ncbi:uracil phosphoribosyltransferase [Mangrovimonas aestuarii]|uniref:uracil phosphoribosyltransferase n=1 Tax=Mangrovimonas aestuarii TaxID=3018443 RepID=UPI0023793633|nr:uracil phosphoribosyltransferase [Mangrovimonas aestuarii]
MQIHNLSLNNSILNKFVSELRDSNIQRDQMRFRRNIERIGEIMAYEISKTFGYRPTSITTPLGNSSINLPEDDVVICSVLRAGVPLHNGLLNYFDTAESAFISAYRHHNSENPEEFEIIIEYLACPDLTDKTLILADPMLATGQSLAAAFDALKPHGTPKAMHLACVIGATQGIDYIKSHVPSQTSLWIAAVDNKLNNYGYIIPGLGDAGDLAFGEKLQH